MSSKPQPFTDEELQKFAEYCYTVFGLHFVGDTMNKHTVMDGDRIVHQVRQSLETINKMKPIYEAAMILGSFVDEKGVVVDGFRTREVLLEIQKASRQYWEEFRSESE